MTGSAVHLTDAEVGSPEWHDARRTRINGSEIAAVMGISPFESPFSLWHRKAGSLPEVLTNDVMYWGTALEPVIREEWNKRHYLEGGLHAHKTGQWRHKDRDWQGGSPDGLIYPLVAEDAAAPPLALLEVKTARYDDEWGEEGTEEIPVHYRAQVLWYLDVFGLQVCHVAALIAGSDYREYAVNYDAGEVELMRLKAREFLDTLAGQVAPRIDGHESTYAAIRVLHPDIDPTSVDLPAAVAVPYLESLAAVRDAEDEKRRCCGLVIDAMGSAKDAYFDGHRIASRQAKSTPGSTPYLVAAKGAADHHQKGLAA